MGEVGGKNRCAQLHAFTRIYTRFPAGWEMEYGSNGVVEGDMGKGGWKLGRKWEKVGWSWEIKPAFPALARLIRRKWLISRVCAG